MNFKTVFRVPESMIRRLSVHDMISKFEGGSLEGKEWLQKVQLGEQKPSSAPDPASESYRELTDYGPVGGANCQWRGLQSFRRRSCTKRLIQRAAPPTLPEPLMEEEEGLHKVRNDEKLYKIANELLETEKAYVSRLHLLDQVFFSELLKEARASGAFPEDVVRQIFSNISSIHQFHSLFLLPELQRRMDEWGENPGIGDVLQKVAPFLKMYGEYVKAFDRATELINTWMEKSPRFEELVLEIQKREESGNLTLQHHMLEPVQRVPRYEMLLKDYLRKLPEDSPDREGAEKSLEIIFEAAKHSNEAIADMERLEKLWEVYSTLGLEGEMVDPSNRLLREGPLIKISFRHNTRKDSHLFLFSNMLLYCVPRFSLTGAKFLIKHRLDIEGMQVKELNAAVIPHCFLVSGTTRTLEFQARSQTDMEAWIKACGNAIERNEKNSESFKSKSATSSQNQELQQVSVLESQELGTRAPQWIRDSLVSMCMRCGDTFNALIRRRHHCRACGHVVCWKCSDFKAPLQYDDNKVNRVCRACYNLLVGQADGQEKERKKGILEKEAGEVSERSLMCSFLTLVDRPSRTRGWFVIARDEPLILYMYAAPQDVKAQITIPLLGYRVKPHSVGDNKCAFQLSQSKQVFTFLAESEELRDRWAEVINRVANGEEPGL
ncbi:FYVE, RhoGEF and PH domain-containing protein 2-like [Conger conger]|uniref:FYVE, RhoGEF and PH domain-containing protein 2-like n=1 Tax=Conger conger TaxID=82655 RepID=UPI002A59C63D|nr:FYVE, RhoGEF and PH domain-containing protein 2-like [Conger conger]